MTDEYKNLMSDKRLGAIIQTNRAIYTSEKDAVEHEVELDEAEELKAELRKRAWKAIDEFVRNTQLANEDEPTAVQMYPKQPIEF